MRFLWLALGGLLFLSCQAPVQVSPQWISLNPGLPSHAPVLALAATPQAIYAATYDTVGLDVSRDAGLTWRADNRGLEPAPVFSLLVEGDTLFAGTAAGLYQRAGPTFTRIGTVPAVAVYALARASNGNLYAATDARGLYTSVDGGATWTRVPGLDAEILLSVVATDAQTILVGTSGHGLFITRDGGATWASVAELEEAYIPLLAADPGDPRTIYASTRRALVRSRDGGATWEALSGGIQNQAVYALLIEAPQRRLVAGTAGRGILMSDDEGTTWQPVNTNLPEGRAVLALTVQGSTMFAGTADGVFVSDDAGATWRASGTGIGAPQLHALTLNPGNGALWLASEDGLYQSRDQGASWQRAGPLLPVLSVALAPNDPRTIYVGTSHQGVFTSHDGGATWGAAGGDLGGRASVAGLTVDPQNAQNVFARVLFERIYKSVDGGDSWRTVWAGMPNDTEVETMAIDPRDSRVMYAGSNNQLYYSTNGGETWQPRGLDGVTTFAVWIDPRDSNSLLAGATDGLYQSHDAGANWEPIGFAHTTVTAITRDQGGNLYVGTKYDGAFVSQDDGKTFNRLGAGLDSASINALASDDTRGIIYAVTNRGLFKLAIRNF
jgi:photosystem II stability/assembly factor-like uncharacterized protein